MSAALAHPGLAMSPDGTDLETEAPFDHAVLGGWKGELEGIARRVAARLPKGESFDLVACYAAPWSLEVAALVGNVSLSKARDLLPHSRIVFEAAAHASGPGAGAQAAAAAAVLAQQLPPSTLGVQTFVALAHTLPHLVAGIWHALLRFPDQLELLRREPATLPLAMEELLRFASPSRIVFRFAVTRLELGGVEINQGDVAQLHLAAANYDPARFPEPDRLDLRRGQSGHLAFGRGRHACAGAQLIRLATIASTRALLDIFGAIEPAGTPQWLDGAAIRGPASLPVILRD